MRKTFIRFCSTVEMSASRKRPPTEEIDGYIAKQAKIEEPYVAWKRERVK